jgi:hypothetical protein
MWQVLNANAGAVQACSAVVIVLLTFVLATATLRYVRLTEKIATASATQTEAVHKPVLTLKQVEVDPSTVEVADLTKLIGDARAGKQHTRIGPILEIVNIGTGPALQGEVDAQSILRNWRIHSVYRRGAVRVSSHSF